MRSAGLSRSTLPPCLLVCAATRGSASCSLTSTPRIICWIAIAPDIACVVEHDSHVADLYWANKVKCSKYNGENHGAWCTHGYQRGRWSRLQVCVLARDCE